MPQGSIFPHRWSPSTSLREIRRVLKPGGRVLITDWCDDYLVWRVCDRLLQRVHPSRQRIFGGRECRRLLQEAGYESIHIERYRIAWLWGLMTAAAVRA